ncbi:MAG: hypothetical protein EB069_08330 [Actinobacteria bacterium]|nr:hypothetical protein [Actinomycetota bacterium]
MSYVNTKDVDQFRKDGYLILKGALLKNDLFEKYLNDIRKLCILAAHGCNEVSSRYDLGEMLAALFHIEPAAPKKIFDLLATPTKLISGMQLKTCEQLLSIATTLLQAELLGYPAASDYAMMFMPGMKKAGNSYQEQHQDFPHLLQSPKQLTFWIPLSKHTDGNGGISIYAGSHSMGLLPFKYNATNSHYEVHDLSVLKECVQVDWDLYDLIILDSLVVHGTIANMSETTARATQLFRYSDLTHPVAVTSGWTSTRPTGNFTTAKEMYKDKLVYEY